MTRPAWLLATLLSLAATPALGQAYGGAREEVVQPDAGHTPVLTKPPQLLQGVEPVYPAEAQAQKLSGDVTMQVDIGADGKVTSVTVLQGAGHGFDEAAAEAVRQFVFSPAEIDNAPAPVRIQYTHHFFFKEPEPPDAGPAEEADAGPPAPRYPISLKGRILERGSRKPLIDAAVKVSSLEEPAITDARGYFEARVPPGEVSVTVLEPSHHPFQTKETIKEGEQLEVTYYVMPKAIGLYETVVRGNREKKEVTRHTLQREELEKVPGSMGDPIRVIQDLPGVARSPFLSGALIVRGASPDETGSYLDGVEIPLLFHFLGGPSVVNPEFLDRIDFYPGGFGAKYGRAIGGIVDVQTRAPKPNEWHGSAKADLIDSGVYVAAPVTDGLTVSAAARRSYIDALLPAIIPFFTDAAVVVAPRYYDYQLRVDYKPPSLPNHSFKLFGFGSDDVLKVVGTGVLPGGASFELNNHIHFERLAGDWTYRNGNLSISTAPHVGLNGLSLGVGTFEVDDLAYVYGLRETLELALGAGFTLRAGLDFQLTQDHVTAHLPAFPLNFRPFPGEQPERPPMELKLGIDEYDYGEWLEGEFKLPGRLKVFPGVRIDQYRLHGMWRPSVAPRLIARWDLGEAEQPWTLKGSAGLYNESPGAENLDPVFGNPDVRLESAFQSSLGLEHKFTDAINVDVTGYYNRRYDLAYGVNQITTSGGTPHRALVDSIGLGRAWGVEVLLRHEITKHFFGWVAYTLSWSQEKARGGVYDWASFDQRHILTLIAQYKLGNGWEFGGRFRLTTGTPDTPIVGTTFDADTQDYRAISGVAGSIRQPPFHQLDLRVDRVFLFDRWTLGLYLDVQNVYDHLNKEGVIYDYRYQTTLLVPDIPILPTLGVRGSF